MQQSKSIQNGGQKAGLAHLLKKRLGKGGMAPGRGKKSE